MIWYRETTFIITIHTHVCLYLGAQTAQVKQQVQAKLEQRLVEKETELLLVRGQLDEVGMAIPMAKAKPFT